MAITKLGGDENQTISVTNKDRPSPGASRNKECGDPIGCYNRALLRTILKTKRKEQCA
jgi:hypothetical protein